MHTCKYILAQQSFQTDYNMVTVIGLILIDSSRTMHFRPIDNVSLAIETKNIIANAACSSRLHLVLVTKKLLSCKTAAIIKLAVGQDPQQGAFPCVDISDNGNTTTQTVIKL